MYGTYIVFSSSLSYLTAYQFQCVLQENISRLTQQRAYTAYRERLRGVRKASLLEGVVLLVENLRPLVEEARRTRGAPRFDVGTELVTLACLHAPQKTP